MAPFERVRIIFNGKFYGGYPIRLEPNGSKALVRIFFPSNMKSRPKDIQTVSMENIAPVTEGAQRLPDRELGIKEGLICE